MRNPYYPNKDDPTTEDLRWEAKEKIMVGKDVRVEFYGKVVKEEINLKGRREFRVQGKDENGDILIAFVTGGYLHEVEDETHKDTKTNLA